MTSTPLPNPSLLAGSSGGWTESEGGSASGAPPKPRRMLDLTSEEGGNDEVGSRVRARDREEVVQEEAVAVIRDGDDIADAAAALERKVADAPRNAGGRKVATLAELDGDRSSGAGALNASASRAAGVDLSLLTASLYPPSALLEADEEWDAGYLLQRITQEMHAEGDKREAAAAEDGVNFFEKAGGGGGGATTTTNTTTAAATAATATSTTTGVSAAGRTRGGA